MNEQTLTEAPARRSIKTILALDGAALVVIVALAALGVWQVHRLTWKRDLIARVEARVHAPAVAMPQRAAWPNVTTAQDEYRHVDATGTFVDVRPVFVQAVTDYGSGFWVMAPLRLSDGAIVLINRGFVPQNKRNAVDFALPTSAQITVTGLLRLSEPGGGFLRANDPAAGRWYSRDVSAIAATQGLSTVAPFFVDADKASGESELPIGGLTIIQFPNNHLAYAITWFALALMLSAAMLHANVRFWKERRLGLPLAKC